MKGAACSAVTHSPTAGALSSQVADLGAMARMWSAVSWIVAREGCIVVASIASNIIGLVCICIVFLGWLSFLSSNLSIRECPGGLFALLGIRCGKGNCKINQTIESLYKAQKENPSKRRRKEETLQIQIIPRYPIYRIKELEGYEPVNTPIFSSFSKCLLFFFSQRVITCNLFQFSRILETCQIVFGPADENVYAYRGM